MLVRLEVRGAGFDWLIKSVHVGFSLVARGMVPIPKVPLTYRFTTACVKYGEPRQKRKHDEWSLSINQDKIL